MFVDHDLRIGLEASLIATRHRVKRSAVIEHWRHCLGMAATLPEPTTVEHAPPPVRSRSISINEMEGDTPREVLREMRAYLQESSGIKAHQVPETPQDILKRGLPYVRQAVRLAGDDPHERERIVAKLNEVLMDENLGLP